MKTRPCPVWRPVASTWPCTRSAVRVCGTCEYVQASPSSKLDHCFRFSSEDTEAWRDEVLCLRLPVSSADLELSPARGHEQGSMRSAAAACRPWSGGPSLKSRALGFTQELLKLRHQELAKQCVGQEEGWEAHRRCCCRGRAPSCRSQGATLPSRSP